MIRSGQQASMSRDAASIPMAALDAAALLKCFGAEALPFSELRAEAERHGRLGDLFPAHHWTRVTSELRALIAK